MEGTMQTYIFDLIVEQCDAAQYIEKDDYTFCVRLFSDFVDLPRDRLGVECFPAQPLGQFTTSACDLIGSLTMKGICVSLRQNDNIIGAGSAQLPPFVLRQLTDPNFLVTQLVKLDIMQRTTRIATIELNVKLQVKHPAFNANLLPFGCFDVCKPLDDSVNPRDVVFSLGRSNKTPVTTCITDRRLMSQEAYPFSCVQSRSLPDVPGCKCAVVGAQPAGPDPEKERVQLQKLLQELGFSGIPTPTDYQAKSPTCKCKPPTTTTDTNSEEVDKDGWSSASQEYECLPPGLIAQEAMKQRKFILNKYCQEYMQPKLKQDKYKPPRLCMLCNADISWLPKMAACPHCGYKYFGEHSEESYDEEATAYQLLQDCLRNPTCEYQSDEDIKLDQGEPDTEALAQSQAQKPCGCGSGRICTRCRIRKLCKHMFRESTKQVSMLAQFDKHKELPAGKDDKSRSPLTQTQGDGLESKQSTGGTPRQKESTVSHRRSQLVKIFTEMRNVYDKNKKPQSVISDLRKECDAYCKEANSTKPRRRIQRHIKQVLKELDEQYRVRKPKKQRKKRRRRSKRYVFLEPQKKDTSEKRIGHSCCISDSLHAGYTKVPCHMGWRWNKSELARYKQWRPGAIARPIRHLMGYFLRDFPLDTICLSRYHYLKRRRRQWTPPEEPLVQHPTLHISKKHDVYTITMRPLKEPSALAVCANPYADMKPVVFRIVKSPAQVANREMKLSLKRLGIEVCRCHKPVSRCFCHSFIDKKRVELEVDKLCRERGWQNMSDTFVYSDVSESDSDAEYEFGVTPPAGIIKPERIKKPDMANCETQYDENDWAMPTMFPHPPNAFVQYGGCVSGERKAFFKWIYGKGNVHEEPKPKMRNKPPPKKAKRGKASGGGRLAGGYVSEEVLNAPRRSKNTYVTAPTLQDFQQPGKSVRLRGGKAPQTSRTSSTIASEWSESQ